MGNKPESIAFRVPTAFKTLLMERAKFHHRSMTGYVEWLVLQEAQTTGQGG